MRHETTSAPARLLAAALAFAVAALAALVLLVFHPASAQASSVLSVSLKAGKTYTSYDVTGDGKADTVKFVQSGLQGYAYKKAVLYVNGKKAYSSNSGYWYTSWSGNGFKLMRTTGGKVFFYFHVGSDNDDGPDAILKWKSGKLAQVLDCDVVGGWVGGYHSYVDSAKAVGSRIVIENSSMSYGLGGMAFTYSYKYSGGKLKRTSATTSKVKIGTYKFGTPLRTGNYLTASKAIQLYSNAKAMKKSFKLTKGQKVVETRAYITKSRQAIKVKTASGKSGWFMIPQSYSQGSKLFEQCFWAG